jgi:hypothetical protein
LAPDIRQDQLSDPIPYVDYAFASNESTRRGGASIELDSLVDDETREMIAIFRRRLFGSRWLPRQERLAAVRAAREWLVLALKGLREKRARERQARFMTVRQLNMQRRPRPD